MNPLIKAKNPQNKSPLVTEDNLRKLIKVLLSQGLYRLLLNRDGEIIKKLTFGSSQFPNLRGEYILIQPNINPFPLELSRDDLLGLLDAMDKMI